ncbi:hypothetical protein M3Y97_00670600 [Aphelenchoides bicaudatus]|nr:hypothetical protein M3Y97_00670600 [Aphelenchoides bicaudatus]
MDSGVCPSPPDDLLERGNHFKRVRFKQRDSYAYIDENTADCGQIGSNSSSAVNYAPMAGDTSLDYSSELYTHRVSSSTKQYRCFCGICHVVLGTKLFLLFYAAITIFGLVFGMVSAMVWTGIPVSIIIFTIYGFVCKQHKYFYPFLIISVVQLIVCLLMSIIVAVFSIFNYETLKMIIAYHLNTEPSASIVITVVGSVVLGCCLLAIIHCWQVLVIHRCLQYYEYDLKPDRAFVSTAGEPTNLGQSLYESGALKPSHAQTAPPIIELGLNSRSSVQHEFSSQCPASALA